MKEIIIPLGTVQKVLVKATKEGMAPSNIGEYEYTVLEGKVATPAIVPDEVTSGKFTITCATSGASIYYTTNGDTPTEDDTPYEEAVTLEATVTVKAKAFKEGCAPSEVTEQLIEVSYSYTNEEAATYAAALTTAPDDTDAEALDTFVGALKTAGVFAKLDSLKVLANWDETGSVGANSTCLFNLIDPTKFKGTVVGTGGVTHTQYTGIYGNGTAAIDDGFNPTTAGIHATQDSLTFGCWRQNKYSEDGKVQMGMKDSTDNDGAYIVAHNSGASVIVSANHVGGVKGGQLDGDMTTVIRNASDYWKAMNNGTWTAICSGTNASNSPKNINYGVLAARTQSTSLAAPSKDTLALSFIGAALTQTEFEDLYAAANTFLTALFARAV